MVEAIPDYDAAKEKDSPLDSLVKKFERYGYTIEQAFQLFDENNDGLLTTKEVRIGIRDQEIQALDSEVDALVKAIDKDANGVAVAGLAKAFASKAPEPRNASGTPTLKFKAGEEITVAMKGVGWTQLDNTMALTYDNNYVGYGCGFNSDGYMVIHLRATGAPGTHIIDLHPIMYTNQPSFANTQYGMLPILSYNTDFLGLALGYKQPAVHFEIQIVR